MHTDTSEDQTSYSERLRHFRDKPVEAKRGKKVVTDMNAVEYDRGKYTDPCISDLCIGVLHFV